mmetsp:Transcript_42715/g.73612  ORF Transcript_42715/g.73612 Transcript_42715/m.73612 type:complete len:139 (-) Transcript_42715:75-491(-)
MQKTKTCCCPSSWSGGCTNRDISCSRNVLMTGIKLDVDYCFKQIALAPHNLSPWLYLRGIIADCCSSSIEKTTATTTALGDTVPSEKSHISDRTTSFILETTEAFIEKLMQKKMLNPELDQEIYLILTDIHNFIASQK